MGCFSYLCKKCGKPVNSNSFSGQIVKLFLLKDGEIIEEMCGEYDSYGRVFHEGVEDDYIEGESFDWANDWGKIVDLHFNDNKHDGIAAVHLGCTKRTPDYKPKTISKDDPNQGWGNYRYADEPNFKPYHKVYKILYPQSD